MPADQLRKTRSARRWSAIEDFWRSASATRVSVELAAKKTTAASRMAGQVAGVEVGAVSEARAAREVEREAGEHPGDGELGEVEDDPVDGAPSDQVRGERGGDLHHDDLRDPVGEEKREGERRGEGLLANLTVNLDREELADEDERGEDPELSVERAEVARAEHSQRREHGNARGAD